MTFKKGDKVFVEFEVLDTCHSSDYMLVKDKSGQTRQFLKSEAQVLPKKVVIPKFVAEWIKNNRRVFNLYGIMGRIKDGLAPSEIMKWFSTNPTLTGEILARAWLDGYEIEQEQLYTVKIPNPHHDGVTVLEKIAGDIVMSQMDFISADWRKEQDYQLTEAEIKQDFEWAWKWAKPAEEVE